MFGKKIGKINYDINQENTSANRKADYSNRVAFLRNYAGELRVTNIFSVIKHSFISAIDESVANDRKHAAKRFGFEMLRSVSQFVIGYEGMWLCAAILSIKGTVSLSDLIVLLNAIGAVSWMLRHFETSLTGLIEFDGKPIADYPLQKYRSIYSTLFQDFQIVAATIGQNITMNNSKLDTKRALESLEKADFKEKFNSFPNGFETQLTKEFDNEGINLSGGESQKLALARVLYANKNIIILDEPSSALDPLAEYQLNKTVTELAGEKTVIIISHRLSTTRFVDKIYMLENGQVVESGNHDDLLKQNGKYAEMFKLQAEKYR